MSKEGEQIGKRNKLDMCFHHIGFSYDTETIAMLCTMLNGKELSDLITASQPKLVDKKVTLTTAEVFEAVMREPVYNRVLWDTLNIYMVSKLAMMDSETMDALFSLMIKESNAKRWKHSPNAKPASRKRYEGVHAQENSTFFIFVNFLKTAGITEKDSNDVIEEKLQKVDLSVMRVVKTVIATSRFVRSVNFQTKLESVCGDLSFIYSMYLKARLLSEDAINIAKKYKSCEKQVVSLQTKEESLLRTIEEQSVRVESLLKEIRSKDLLLQSKSFKGEYEARIRELTTSLDRSKRRLSETEAELNLQIDENASLKEEVEYLRECVRVMELEESLEAETVEECSFKDILKDRMLLILGGREDFRRNLFSRLEEEGVFYKYDAVSKTGRRDTPKIIPGCVVVFNVSGISHSYFQSQIENLRASDIVLIITHTQNLHLLSKLISEELTRNVKA